MEELDISGLSVGMVVPNYKKMCELLGDRVRTGDAKVCQLKRWERLFRYEREGNKYRILEVTDRLSEKVPRKRKGEYIQYIEPVLIDYICRNGRDGHRISLIRKELFYIAGLVNSRYLASGRAGEIYGDISGFEIDEDVKEDFVAEDDVKFKCSDMFWFRLKTARWLNYVLNSALRSMQRRKVIDVDYEYVVTILDKDGNARTRAATDRQLKAIRAAEEDVLEEMGVLNTRVIYSTSRTWEFYARLNKILTTEYGWKGAFRRTVITLNDEYVAGGKLRKNKVQSFKRILNGKIMEFLSKEAEKDKAAFDSGEYPYNPNSWRSKTLNEAFESESFLETQKMIADYLIKI